MKVFVMFYRFDSSLCASVESHAHRFFPGENLHTDLNINRMCVWKYGGLMKFCVQVDVTSGWAGSLISLMSLLGGVGVSLGWCHNSFINYLNNQV